MAEMFIFQTVMSLVRNVSIKIAFITYLTDVFILTVAYLPQQMVHGSVALVW